MQGMGYTYICHIVFQDTCVVIHDSSCSVQMSNPPHSTLTF